MTTAAKRATVYLDLASFAARAGEPNLRFEDFVRDLKKRGGHRREVSRK